MMIMIMIIMVIMIIIMTILTILMIMIMYISGSPARPPALSGSRAGPKGTGASAPARQHAARGREHATLRGSFDAVARRFAQTGCVLQTTMFEFEDSPVPPCPADDAPVWCWVGTGRPSEVHKGVRKRGHRTQCTQQKLRVLLLSWKTQTHAPFVRNPLRDSRAWSPTSEGRFEIDTAPWRLTPGFQILGGGGRAREPPD